MDSLAKALESRNVAVVVARPRAPIDTGVPYLAQWLDGVVASWNGPIAPPAIVGFSAAGPRLAALQDRFRATGNAAGAVVYLDARLPADGASADAEVRFAELLDSLAVDGVLPRWTQWWGENALAELVPDPAMRDELDADCLPIPRAFFSEPIPAPADLSPAAYVALGSGYDDQCQLAEARGWPVVRLRDAHHLWVLTRPAEVARAILQAIEAL